MRHYVLTRSAYPPTYPLAANRRRLALLRRVTARSLKAQTTRDWTWVLAVHGDDPLRAEREAIAASVGVPVIMSVRPGRGWADVIPTDAGALTTRLDDDDALARDALERIARAAQGERMALTMPHGYRYSRARCERVSQRANMFISLASPEVPPRIVMEATHGGIGRLAPLHVVDRAPGWLWVRHRDARSGVREARGSLDPAIMRAFAVDWPWLRTVQ